MGGTYSILKSQMGWDDSGYNTDGVGFSAIPAGWRSDDYFPIGGADYDASFWSATERNSDNAYGMILGYDFGDEGLLSLNKDYGFSIRCIQD